MTWNASSTLQAKSGRMAAFSLCPTTLYLTPHNQHNTSNQQLRPTIPSCTNAALLSAHATPCFRDYTRRSQECTCALSTLQHYHDDHICMHTLHILYLACEHMHHQHVPYTNTPLLLVSQQHLPCLAAQPNGPRNAIQCWYITNTQTQTK